MCVCVCAFSYIHTRLLTPSDVHLSYLHKIPDKKKGMTITQQKCNQPKVNKVIKNPTNEWTTHKKGGGKKSENKSVKNIADIWNKTPCQCSSEISFSADHFPVCSPA